MKKLYLLIPILFILSACSSPQSKTNYYLSLTGESETWELNGYELMFTQDGKKIGNGKLNMKEEEYFTDFFSFNTHVVKNGVDNRIHAGSVSGRTNISEQMTGTIEGEDGKPVSFEEVSNIYMIVKWWDTDKNEDVQERIDLYEKPEKEETFLN
ncbi:hypothetical protein ACLIBG_08405 [Virgibacillus sp. W0181]|uniref:hypothetical protein n=1 Tax=Virgibacillus sp. W0181 TaxID=3391581 RepID=UPI003F482A53